MCTSIGHGMELKASVRLRKEKPIFKTKSFYLTPVKI